MPEFCKAERQGRILIVTINRPEVMNSLHPPANRELAKLWDEFADGPGALDRDHHRARATARSRRGTT